MVKYGKKYGEIWRNMVEYGKKYVKMVKNMEKYGKTWQFFLPYFSIFFTIW